MTVLVAETSHGVWSFWGLKKRLSFSIGLKKVTCLEPYYILVIRS